MDLTLMRKIGHLQIPLEDVLVATNNFADENIISLGDFGPAYKGRLLWSGNLIKIAAKRLDPKFRDGYYHFWNEVSILSDLNHKNVTSIIGFCDEKGEKIIITPSMANGSLQGDLDNPYLTWMERLKISIGVARALGYLRHDEGRNYGVIHRNINSSTILLDENWEPKLSGFGMSIKQSVNRDDRVILCEPIGARGYMDPEIIKAKGVTYKSDIYAFGVVLFEILCGREAFIEKEDEAHRFLAPLAKSHYENITIEEIIHPNLRHQAYRESVMKYSEVAYSCLKEDVTHRSEVNYIISQLERILKLQLGLQNIDNKDLQHLKIPLCDILLASNNFSETCRCSWGNDIAWYIVERDHFDKEKLSSEEEAENKGELPMRRNKVLIKRFLPTYENQEEFFFTEFEILVSINHPNIVKPIGFCVEGSEMILVFENPSNGHLQDYLEGTKEIRILRWEKRLKICIDVAHALNYLHSKMEDDKVILHTHITSAKFELDEKWGAKLDDFETAISMPSNQEVATHYLNQNVGTIYYKDPNHDKTGLLSRESDVYSFGVVLFEILRGKRTHEPIYLESHKEGLAPLARRNFDNETLKNMIDPTIKDETNKDSLHTFIEIAYQCVAETEVQRPTMEVVIKELEKSFLFHEEQVQQRDKNQVVDELQKATHEISEQVQQDKDQVVDELQKENYEIDKANLENLGNDFQHLKIPLDDIKEATCNFSDKYKFEVYAQCSWYRVALGHLNIQIHSSVKGKHNDKHPIGHDNVVIKRYPSGHHIYGVEMFSTEVKMLTSVKHRNIVALLGFCVEGSEMIIVIENISNGFFGSYLREVNKMRLFTWEKRLKICIDVANALNYLHYEMEDQRMILNHDICSYGIGLDENWEAKIVNFWLSVFLPPNQEDEALDLSLFSQQIYTDPEYLTTNKLKRESDVYSFGVVLFEALCGRLAGDPIYLHESDKGLAAVARISFCSETLEDMIDPIIKKEISENNFFLNQGPNKNSLHTFIETAYQCVGETQNQRPTMKIIIEKLEKALFFQQNNKDNPSIPLEDIYQATQNFHNDNCVGGGGFGKVYKGNLQNSEGFKTIVAKRLNTMFGQGEQQFLTELQILLEYNHENIISLVGYCDEKDEKIIVYEHAPKGSLDRYLNDGSLTWVKRLNICIDVASALAFLHGGVRKQARVIHRDIKPANILLSHGWKAKLGDFGLSLLSPLFQETDYVIDHVCGTPGYLDPLYKKSGFLTIESDIYSFGVVLFEVLCGRSTFAIEKQDGYSLPNFIKKKFEEGKEDQVVFKQIREQIMPKSLTTFQEIAYQCLHHEREKRPTTKKVAIQLKKALEFQNMPSTIAKYAHLQIPLEDVLKATNNFCDDYIIGHGDFGSTYKGRLLRSGRFVEIVARRFDCKHREGDLMFSREISALSDLSHPNVLSIIGYCDAKDEKIVVTTYDEANGNIRQYVNCPDLTWTQRLRVCVGVAHALSYLHDVEEEGRDYSIIHCNINSDTILFDENWEAKLCGFEHSIKQLKNYKDQVSSCDEHVGTMQGYMDPAIEKTGGVTQKSDIYSLGVILFEVLCGRRAFIDHENEANRFLVSLAKYHYENKSLKDILNVDLYDQMSPHSLLKYSNLAYSCLKEDRAHRPDINYIVNVLEELLKLQLRYENIVNNFQHLVVSLHDIKSATHNFEDTYSFHVDAQGCNWYRVELGHFQKENHSFVVRRDKAEHPTRHNMLVVKRYPFGNDVCGDKEFLTEIEVLNRVKHSNIVTLLGFCVEETEMVLVIDDISNGFLGSYLEKVNGMCIFTWEKRLKICIDIAHALNYLHYEMEDQEMIIHRDIYSYNIGLDKNWGARIMVFEDSILLPPNKNDDGLYLAWVGRLYNTDPEYQLTNKLKRESDVYSFGVTLFEILCGKLASDSIYLKKSDKGLAVVARQGFYSGTLEEMIDPLLKEETNGSNFVLNRGPNKDSLNTFTNIAMECVVETQDQRPTMKVVIKELEKALLFQENNKDNPKIRLEDIKLATQNFHDANCVGGGEVFGKVYKGNLQDGDGFKTIAARRLGGRFSGQVEKQFSNELQILWEYKHKNVISLVGYCDEQDEKIIVYEYASRRSLDRYLNDDSLTWLKRLSICIDIARALDFFHGGGGKQAKVIHGDIKTASILLNRDWKAKLADLRLSLKIPIAHEIEHVTDYACGTPGYVDPDYKKSGYLTTESDVYSVGVVLFEILCGRSTSAILKHEGDYLPGFIQNKFEEGKYEEVVFEQIREQIMPGSLTMFQDIAYQCLHQEREKRPTAKEVLAQLKKALEFQNMASALITKFAHLRIRHEDVVMATDNFHHDNIIGQRGLVTAYKGQLLRSERMIEITARRFDRKHREGHLKFLKESTLLLDLEHTNIVSIIGFCDEKDEKIIVTMYEANGNLGQCLVNNTDLTWTQRLRVCVGVARALSYLHDVKQEGRDYSIIHCNINSHTILLDENWEAKLYGFEHSIKQVDQHYEDLWVSYCDEHIGTMKGYMDPAIVKTGGVTHKSDVYSFGVILFEVLCGRREFIDHEKEANRFLVSLAKHHYENKSLKDILNVDLYDQMSPHSLLKYSNLAYSCLIKDGPDRPCIKYVVNQLEEALKLQLRYENIVNNFQHLKVPLQDIKSATRYFEDTYRFSSYGDAGDDADGDGDDEDGNEDDDGDGDYDDDDCSWYRVELDLSHKENNAFVEEEDIGEHPKKHNNVVIKRYASSGYNMLGEEEFFTEIEMLNHVKHPNIVTLLGLCVEENEMILVIDDVSNGFLGSYLEKGNGMRIFTWEKRLKICIDVAHALTYLHSEMEDQNMIINRGIHCYGIGLDEKWGAQIMEFEDSIFLPPNQEEELYLKAVGRPCYIDPEYNITSKLKRESDVYSFGVILFEILCGRLAYDPIYLKESERGLVVVARQSFCAGTLEEMIDPIIKEEVKENKFVLRKGPNKDSLNTFIEIAMQCVAETQEQRPSMKFVVKELEKALLFQISKGEGASTSTERAVRIESQRGRKRKSTYIDG